MGVDLVGDAFIMFSTFYLEFFPLPCHTDEQNTTSWDG